MLSGNRRKPTINPTSVEAALNTLVYTTTDTSDAATLLSLFLVEEYLHDPARPPAKNLREFALKSILCSLIEQTLAQYRMASELPVPTGNDTVSTAAKQIQLDSQQNSADLLGWSYLYYRFVRVDMGISHDAYAEYANVETRSLRRYKKFTIDRLAERLIEAEWAARRRQHHTRLLSAIPTDTNRPLIGREHQLENTLNVLRDGLATRCYVTGGIGIGKTAFLAVVTRHLIEADMLDYVVWVNSPRTVDDVVMKLQEAVMPPHSRLELRDILVRYRVLLVIDDIVNVHQSPSEFSSLLDFLAPCLVFMASEQQISLKNPVYHIHLNELNQAEVHELIQFLKADATISPSVSATIWQQVGGNPQAVQLAVLGLGINIPATYRAATEMHSSLFNSLPHAQQCIWLLVAAMKDRLLPASIMGLVIQHGVFSQDDLNHLLNIFIIQHIASQDAFTLSQSAQTFALQQLAFQSRLEPVVDSILSGTEGLASNALHDFCLQLLQHEAPIFRDAKTLKLIHAGWRANERFHQLPQWEAIFNRYKLVIEGHHPLQLAYAVCLRQLNRVQTSQAILEMLVARTGQKGDFPIQALVLLEMAILYRKQGQYTIAQECLAKAMEIERLFSDRLLYERIMGEYALIEIERSRPAEALKWLEKMDSASLTTNLLKAEVLFLLSRLKECQRSAYQILGNLQKTHDVVRLISLYTTLARSYQQQGQVEKAIDCYNAAISYAEQQQDIFAVARLKTNMATLLLYQNDIVTAEQLLVEAEETQRHIVDKIGLEATHHNLQHLKHLKAKLS